MNKTNKKITSILVSALVLVTSLGFGSAALASSDSNNKDHLVRGVSADDLGSTTISVPVMWNKFKNKSVDVTVRWTNVTTGKMMEKVFNTHLNDNGKGRVLVTGLTPSTEFRIKAKINKEHGGDGTGFSDSKTLFTKAAGGDNPTSGSAKVETGN